MLKTPVAVMESLPETDARHTASMATSSRQKTPKRTSKARTRSSPVDAEPAFAERPLRVVWLGNVDTGGQGVRVAAAFAKYAPSWDVRSMVKDDNGFHYPIDLPYRRRSFDELYQMSDVVHVRNHFGDYDRASKEYGSKPVVLHVHGAKFRANPNYYIREARERNATILCSTLDLYLLAPDDAVWLPSPHDLDELMAIRERVKAA